MIELTADEARILGVLIEKATTTPDQYPLTLNAAMNGANQKNNRDPIVSFDDLRTLEAMNGLRAKGLVVQVDSAGARVPKYRHEAGDKLGLGKASLVLLAELMLRGPQTLGELRGRASRMHPFETLEQVRGILDTLIEREEPLIRRLSPLPGSRAERYMQLLAPDAHPIDGPQAGEGASDTPVAAAGATGPSINQRVAVLEGQVAALESQVATLQAALRKLAAGLGEADPLADAEPSASPASDTPA